jgi:hypothetical protein
VRQLAEFLLVDTLATKAPLLAYNHFVESMFVMNGCIAGLHGARLGASLGAGAKTSGAVAAGASGRLRAGEIAEEDGAEQLEAPVQFMLQGQGNRWEGGHRLTLIAILDI